MPANSSTEETLRPEQAAALLRRLQFTKAAYAKSKTIDVTDSDQITRWCRVFGATPFQLFRAIGKVGADAALVQRQLQLR